MKAVGWKIFYLFALVLVFFCGAVLFQRGYFTRTESTLPIAYSVPKPSYVATPTPVAVPKISQQAAVTTTPVVAIKKKVTKSKVCVAYIGKDCMQYQ